MIVNIVTVHTLKCLFYCPDGVIGRYWHADGTIGKTKNASFDVMQVHVMMSINRRSETKRQNEKKDKRRTFGEMITGFLLFNC